MPQVTIPNYNPPIEGKRAAVVYASVTVADPIAPTELKIGIGANVPLRRQNEILSAIKFLANGIRDRNLLEGQFNGSALITAVNINRITFAGRRTASSAVAASVTADDVFISMGATATGAQHRLPLDTAIEAMSEVLFENLKDQAA